MKTRMVIEVVTEHVINSLFLDLTFISAHLSVLWPLDTQILFPEMISP